MKTYSRLRAAVGAGSILFAIGLAACGGGGSSPTPIAIATAAPTSAPTTTPTVAPSPPAAQRAVAAAPDTIVTTSGLIRSGSEAYRRALAASVPNGIPKIITSFSANPNWGGIAANMFVWVYSTVSAQTVPTTSLNLALDPALRIAGAPILDTSGRFGLSNDWSAFFNPPTQTGQLHATAAFDDGTTGIITIYSYDTWFVGCNGGATPLAPGSTPLGNAYLTTAPTPSTIAAADVSIDCAGNNLVFPHGAILASAPVADSTGNVLPTIATVTATTGVPTTTTTFALSSLHNGQVYVARTGTGGFAKFQPDHSTATAGQGLVAGEALFTSGATFAF